MSYESDVEKLYANLYWPILQKIVPSPKAPKMNVRFPNASACKKEAMECAKFHAGMLYSQSGLNVYKIINDINEDPWQRFNGFQVDQTAMRNAAGYFVVNVKTKVVYDHRVRYCIPEPWAFTLGFINPLWVWDKMGAPKINPYAGHFNSAANKFYKNNGNLKSKAGYVA